MISCLIGLNGTGHSRRYGNYSHMSYTGEYFTKYSLNFNRFEVSETRRNDVLSRARPDPFSVRYK